MDTISINVMDKLIELRFQVDAWRQSLVDAGTARCQINDEMISD